MKQIKGVKLKKVITGAFFALALALYPVAANAHTYYQYQGNDMGYVNVGHGSGGIADRECDGHKVSYFLWKENGDFIIREDTDGCNNGVKSWTISGNIAASRVCERKGEQTIACSPTEFH